MKIELQAIAITEIAVSLNGRVVKLAVELPIEHEENPNWVEPPANTVLVTSPLHVEPAIGERFQRAIEKMDKRHRPVKRTTQTPGVAATFGADLKPSGEKLAPPKDARATPTKGDQIVRLLAKRPLTHQEALESIIDADLAPNRDAAQKQTEKLRKQGRIALEWHEAPDGTQRCVYQIPRETPHPTAWDKRDSEPKGDA